MKEMKLQTQVTLSESQKAQIVARGEVLQTEYTFEMSAKYAAIFSQLDGYTTSYSVSNDLIKINRIGELYAGVSFTEKHWIADDFKSAIAGGTLKNEASCDKVMQKIADTIIAIAATKQAAKEKADRERPAREEAEERARGREARDAEARKAEEVDRKATRQAEIDAAKAEKLAWIKTHGSERLQKGIAAGYHCQKIYVAERGNAELGSDYLLDYDEKIATKDRSCPSLEALNEAERLTEAGIKARVKWLPDGTATEEDCHDYQCDMKQSCEAVEAIFLGSYFYMETA